MATAKNKLLTAEDLLRLHGQGVKGELIDGVLKEKVSAGAEHSFIGIRLGGEFDRHARRHRLGRVGGTDGGVLVGRNPDNVREPDVFFVSAERLPLDLRVQGYLEVVPELVVEIVSPSDSETYVTEKIAMWLDFGVSMALEVRPADQGHRWCTARALPCVNPHRRRRAGWRRRAAGVHPAPERDIRRLAAVNRERLPRKSPR